MADDTSCLFILYVTSHFLPTCMSPNLSCTVRDRYPPRPGPDLLHDLHAAQESVQDVTTQDERHQGLYQQWLHFCAA